MTAYIVKLTAEESAVMQNVLTRTQERAIYLYPDQVEKLKAAGVEIEDGILVDYDFGGEPDICVDRLNFCSLAAILHHVGIPDDEFNEEDPAQKDDWEKYQTNHEKIKQQILGNE